ncbi:MAG: hypothetical protein JNM83_22510 [Myxococcales bacterium]|jgi:hypothetical protein|nr:hypothetical protein [Myxococcales bacterium]
MLDLTSWALSSLLYAADGELRLSSESSRPRIVRVLTAPEQTALPPELSWVDITASTLAAPISPESSSVSASNLDTHPTMRVLEDSIMLIGSMSGIPINQEHDELVSKRLNQRMTGRTRRLIKS